MRTIYKILISFVLITLLVGGIIYGWGNQWAEDLVSKRIQQIEELQYDSLSINIADRSLYAEGITYTTPDLFLKADTVKVENFRLLTLLLTKNVVVGELSVAGADVRYTSPSTRDTAHSSNKSQGMPVIEIKHLLLKNGQFTLFHEKDSVRLPLVTTKLKADIKNAEWSASQALNTLLQVADYRVSLSDIHYNFPDSLYRAAIVQADISAGVVTLQGTEVTCRYEKYQLGPHAGHELDWMSLKLDSAIFYPDISRILNEGGLFVKKTHLIRPTLEVFRDKRLPFPKNHRPSLLRDILADTTLIFGIDSIRLDDADLAYEEYVKAGDGPGKVTFTDLDADITNLYSYRLKLLDSPRLRARTILMNAATLYADILFPRGITGQTIVKGKLEKMDMKAFNPMLQYVAFTRIKAGQLQRLDFNFSYNQKEAKGEMNFAYQGLKIDFLNKENAETGGFFNEIKGFAANTFVVNTDNNFDSNKFRVGEIAVERNMEKSMFNFWWKSTLSGLRSSTGIKPAGEKIDTN